MLHRFRFLTLLALAVALIAVGIVSSGSPVNAAASGPAENAGIPPGFSKVTFIDFPGGRSDVIVEHGPNRGGGPPGQDVGSVCTGGGTDQCDTNSFDGKKWFELPVLYNVNLRNSGDDGNFLSAIQASAQTWEDDPNSAFYATFNGTTGRKSSSLKNRMDGNSDITWESLNRFQNPIAIAIFWSFTSTGEIVEFDVTNNVNFAWSSNGGPGAISEPDNTTGLPTKFDVQDIDTHELGHAFAGLIDLTHAHENKLTMYGFGSEGELLKRTLGLGDQLSIASAYPADTTAPSFSSGSVAADGTTVTVTFDEALADSAPPGSAFAVTGSVSGTVSGTADAVSISGTGVTFTLASPLVEGETATLAYVQPASDPRIQDAAGNLTASFSGEAITNNTAAPAAEDTVTIAKAVYNSRKGQLQVEATSSASTGDPATSPTLTITSLDPSFEMTYNAKKDKYSVKVTLSPKPNTVTVTSSLGGSDTSDVGGR